MMIEREGIGCNGNEVKKGGEGKNEKGQEC